MWWALTSLHRPDLPHDAMDQAAAEVDTVLLALPVSLSLVLVASNGARRGRCQRARHARMRQAAAKAQGGLGLNAPLLPRHHRCPRQVWGCPRPVLRRQRCMMQWQQLLLLRSRQAVASSCHQQCYCKTALAAVCQRLRRRQLSHLPVLSSAGLAAHR